MVFVLRRTQAPKWINFRHRGGRRRRRRGGQLLAPERVAGRVVAHHGDVAHGVTRHEAGMRNGLFALVAREGLKKRKKRGGGA